MGCASSKIETEAPVKHCKARKQHIKQAVAHRHAFAAAHASYAKSLKNTGAALRQMADAEAIPEGAAQPGPASQSMRHVVSNLPPPPQPPEGPLSGPRSPLPRAASMPPITFKSLGGSPSNRPHPQALDEDNEELYEDQGFSLHKPTHSDSLYDPFDNFSGPGTSTFDNEDFELKGMRAEDDEDEQTFDEHYQAQTAMPQARRSVEDKALFGRETKKQPQVPPVQQRTGKGNNSFGTLLHMIDDRFLYCYEKAGDVSRLLEAKRDYHHVPFVDEKSGIKQHDEKISKILTWTQPPAGTNLANDESDLHNLASTLDRLHAWEKKLYDEVKAAEATRLELERKSAQLKNLREGHEASATFEKTKALVKSLNTRYLVEIEAMDAAHLEVEKLRDKSLYPQLMNLLEALKVMWGNMYTSHQAQVPWVEELSNLATPSTKENSESCKRITEDLEREVALWHDSLQDMVSFQQKCAMSLLDWLDLNAKPIERDGGDYFPVSQNEEIPLFDTCREWGEVVKRISAENVLQNLKQFSSILQVVATKQADEIKQKRRKEELCRELEKKRKAFEAFENKYKEKAAGSKGAAQGSLELSRHPVQERRALIELLQKNVAEEEQRHARLCEENSTMIFQSLKEGLPDVVESIATFSHTCAKEYGKLHTILRSEKVPSQVSPSESSVD